MKQATLIYNPIAGGNLARRASQMRAAVEALRQSAIAVHLAATSGPEQARALARAAVSAGEDLILVCGGDGTINEVVNGMASSQVPLGILPGGTANIAAKELMLPHDPVSAALELPQWSARRIALGRAVWREEGSGSSAAAERSRHFLCVAGIGFDAFVISQMADGSGRYRGVPAYVAAGMKQFFRYSFPLFTCRMGQEEFRASFAIVHRSRRYAGWFPLAPGASLFSPGLTFCAFTSRSRWRYAVYAGAVMLQRHPELPDVKLLRGDRVICGEDSKAMVQFELDGELAGQLPATFEVVPNILTILAP